MSDGGLPGEGVGLPPYPLLAPPLSLSLTHNFPNTLLLSSNLPQ